MKKLEPSSASYTAVYKTAGLLTPRTNMAHCVHLSQQEIQLLKDTGTGVSHCPNSNCSIRSGNMDIRVLQRHGVKVGLGTDCSAGYSVSMLDAMRQVLKYLMNQSYY